MSPLAAFWLGAGTMALIAIAVYEYFLHIARDEAYVAKREAEKWYRRFCDLQDRFAIATEAAHRQGELKAAQRRQIELMHIHNIEEGQRGRDA